MLLYREIIGGIDIVYYYLVLIRIIPIYAPIASLNGVYN